MYAETSFKRFFRGLGGKPWFKKKRNQDMGVYFPKNNKGDLLVERHRIKVPTTGWVRLKEKGYISINAKVKSCTFTQQADRFYVSVIVEDPDPQVADYTYTEGIGVELGIKSFSKVSNGQEFRNINKSPTIKRVEKRLKRAQRALSRKLESIKK
jgi:putative transposase